jgi:hypothetical protein
MVILLKVDLLCDSQDCLWTDSTGWSEAQLTMYSVLQTVGLFKAYFGGQFDEDAIRNNFVLIYELLDGE